MLKLQKDRCTSCGLCTHSCPFGAIHMEDGYPVTDAACTECGLCTKKCASDALSLAETKSENNNTQEYSGFWVVGLESPQENISKVTLELLSEARRLADIKNTQVTLLTSVPSEENITKTREKQALSVGCDQLVLMESEGIAYNPDYFVSTFTDTVTQLKPEAVLFPATVNGRDLAPKAACRLRTGLTADCTGLDIDQEGNLIQIRPTYGGSIMASIITPDHRPQMASIRPNVMKIRYIETDGKELNIKKVKSTSTPKAERIKYIKSEELQSTFADLNEANIVIAGGYGLKNKENFKKLFNLCSRLNAAAAATRKAVDEGWAPPEIQVGQTGTTVAPDIYIAFGISGALQHTLGFKNAKKIIAVNSDPAAPIFNICDAAILGDAAAVLSECCQKITG